MFCQRCGNTLAPGARFCNSCGTPVTALAAPISLARPTLVTVIAILHFIGGLFMLLGGVAVLVAGSENTPDRPAMIVFGVVFLIFAVLSLAAGVGLWKLREWGRILQIVLAVIGLLGIPLGTIISILLLIYFTRPHIKLLFAGKRLDQLTPEETALLSQTASSAGSGAAVAIAVIVVVLVIVAIVGILAAIAIPNLLTAMERSKQKRTMADIRSIAASVEVSRASQNALPQTMPARKDGWGTDIVYKNDGTNYWIVSAGKDARFEEEDPSHYSAGATTNFDCDIVFGNGEFRRAPEGVQQQ